MKVLLVDNGTTLIKKLKDLIPGKEIIHAWDDLADVNPNDFDLTILSGGSRFEIVGHEEKLKDEISIIKTAVKPLVGICYGCELIAESFGGMLEKSGENLRGIIEIDVVFPDHIFGGRKSVKVYENHRWQIKSLPPELIPLARSAHCIEAIRHKDRPIYGFQFHPEQFVEQTDGDEIFLNLFNEIEREIVIG